MEPRGPITVAAVLAVWVSLSAGLIIFNAALLSNFRHPILLTCWHQFVSVVLIMGVCVAFPSVVYTGDREKQLPPLTFRSGVWLGLPVAVCHSVSLVCGNTAIMYLSLAFCQMIKAFTPAGVYLSGCVLGTQQWSIPIVKCLCIITCGLVVTSIGELNFNLFGFVMQVTALLCEGLRINFLELRLKSQGYNLNALSSVMIFAPMVCALLFGAALLFDRSAFDAQQIGEIGVWVFSANAVLAFLLNVVIYLAIQCASGLVFSLTGILKDFLIVVGSCVFQGGQITTTQLVGYAIAVAGLQAYGVVSRSPADFEDGVVGEFLRRAKRSSKEDRGAIVSLQSDSTGTGDGDQSGLEYEKDSG